ncbi:hypothetical protein M0812_18927 [Anaeramoeba flamelloides]|uniref:Nucleoside 2-deoxyribosyltransferase like n=1 Tax=Anaeramoeba flamelloides TaxID=1746091 RepID=A0AAV7Z8G6_9EUKA|nr:hypothetical protein M0812_18927 [Anaeramoeba flamelloides]|eukprot:Anaeramoba_flamelloidesa87990_28.p1 GENE.a87990_28~~a87990_28.p1  ORF type:complete len:169 (-),score=35.13 a87990_28:78-584(-)
MTNNFQEIQAPNKFEQVLKTHFTCFLAGSIEGNSCRQWQSEIVERLKEVDNLVLLNPRRENWDNSWKQSSENNYFTEQVEWELHAQEKCSMIIMNLEPNTKSPISLLELGLFAKTGKMLMHCPLEFWKSGNVHITCKRYGVEMADSFDELVETIKKRALEYSKNKKEN